MSDFESCPFCFRQGCWYCQSGVEDTQFGVEDTLFGVEDDSVNFMDFLDGEEDDLFDPFFDNNNTLYGFVIDDDDVHLYVTDSEDEDEPFSLDNNFDEEIRSWEEEFEEEDTFYEYVEDEEEEDEEEGYDSEDGEESDAEDDWEHRTGPDNDYDI